MARRRAVITGGVGYPGSHRVGRLARVAARRGGCAFAGRVEAMGREVRGLREGDRVALLSIASLAEGRRSCGRW